jgi:transmembrane sensor
MDDRQHDSVSELLPVRKSAWTAERSRSALANVHTKLAQRSRIDRRAIVILAAAACGLLALLVWPTRAPELAEKAPEAPALTRDGRTLRFADGSAVHLLDDRSEVEVLATSAQLVELRLSQGRGHFSVTPHEQPRRFVVRVDDLTIEVLGTAFTVVREPGRVHVSVERGKVQVRTSREQRLLVAGEAAWFGETLEPAVAAQVDEPALPVSPEPPAAKPASEGAEARERFLEHARGRRYARAMQVLRERPGVVHDNAEELMLAADSARLSGDAAAAVPFLRRVAEQHARDSRAPLAAFTLGRILLFELGRPGEARAAFALTQKLSARGALAEDALAREVEAARGAGQRDAVRTLAHEYLTRYPEGRRRAEVMRLRDAP